MQAELRKPGEASRYNGVFHAYKTIFYEEGAKGLYKGDNILPEPFPEHYILIIWNVYMFWMIKIRSMTIDNLHKLLILNKACPNFFSEQTLKKY